MFCAIGNAASPTVKPPANSLRIDLITFWSIKLLSSSNNYGQLNTYFVTKGEEKHRLPCRSRSHLITGSTEQEIVLAFKLYTRKTNASLPLLFFFNWHSTIGIRSELFFSLPLAPCWSCSCDISSTLRCTGFRHGVIYQAIGKQIHQRNFSAAFALLVARALCQEKGAAGDHAAVPWERLQQKMYRLTFSAYLNLT